VSLRHLAHGRRFLRSAWNVFDVLVVWGSIALLVVAATLTASSGSVGANGSSSGSDSGIATAADITTTLRVLSRVAMGLRIARVLLHLHASKRFSVQTRLRGVVSQNKRRYRRHGFDLDLTYITDRVIAMAAPTFGQHSAYRNDVYLVARYLAARHYGAFLVLNLCDTAESSDGERACGSAEAK
jgi:hypothetical protein